MSSSYSTLGKSNLGGSSAKCPGCGEFFALTTAKEDQQYVSHLEDHLDAQ